MPNNKMTHARNKISYVGKTLAYYLKGTKIGGVMCKHQEIELIARIENYQEHRSINLYSCRHCSSTVVMKNKSTPVVLNGEFKHKRSNKFAV